MSRLAVLPALVLAGACVYFNTMYNAQQEYDRGIRSLRDGDQVQARIAFDSVIAKAERVLEKHADSKYADDAALLKTRSELHNKLWESASASAVLAGELASDGAGVQVANGLQGIATYNLGQLERADSLLSTAVEGQVSADDRAVFLFNRGKVRLGLQQPGSAAEDLRTASRQIDLSDEIRLDLAVALARIGEIDQAIDLTEELLQNNRRGDLSDAMRVHLDSLSRRAPSRVDAMLAELTRQPVTESTKLSMLFYLRGRSRQHAGDTTGALVMLDSAVTASPNSRFAADASYYAARQRLRDAKGPEEASETVPSLGLATRSWRREVATDARRLEYWARRFDLLMEAYDSRGASAAEAVLRAAEVAGTELRSPALARGLYLRYLELAPESPWAAKALRGALAYSEHRPGDWVQDDGERTDEVLRRRLRALPADDPYRMDLAGAAHRTPLTDSLYVRAERDLRDRIAGIQMLFDPVAGRGALADTVQAAPDTAAEAREPIVAGEEDENIP
jgi:tetratricopeptide (TPR) repeat protein